MQAIPSPSTSSLRRTLLAGLVALLAGGPALADPPAALHASGDERARTSFSRFAESWMEKVHRLEEEERQNPTVRPGPSSPVVTYRGYGEDFTIELRPTGHPSAPYVGILRYSEHLYTCPDVSAIDCTVASTVPVTEIFRFQDGRWIY